MLGGYICPMLSLIRTADVQEVPPASTVRVDGEAYGAGASVLFTRGCDVQSPDLHQHDYSETFVVVAGRVAVRGGAETVEATGGDVVVVGPRTPHTFTHLGADELVMVHIHASPKIVTEWL